MKKVFALMMVAGVFAFASCKKENAEETATADSTVVETVATEAPAADSTAAAADSTAPAAAPAAEAPAAH